MDLAVVYIVAGMSSRFGGRGKQLIKVGPDGESLIEYSANQALKAGFNKLIFVVGEKTEKSFKEIFGDEYKGAKVEYGFQSFDPEKRDKPWGTTDATTCAADLVKEPFVVCNGDDIYGENSFVAIANHLREGKGAVTMGFKLGSVLSDEGPVNRGIFVVEGDRVKELKENFSIDKDNLTEKGLSEDDLCSMSIFGFNKEVMPMFKEIIYKFKIDNEGDRKIECLLPNDIGSLIKEGKIEMKIIPASDQWFGVTSPDDEPRVREELARLK